MVATKTKNGVDLTEGPFLKKIILFMLPVMCTSLLQSLYNSADLAIVGHFRGDLALAAVGSTGAITSLTINFFMGLSVGAGVVLSHNIGALNHVGARKTVHTSILLAVIMGVANMILGILAAPYLLRLMGTPDTIIDAATLYMRIIFLGLPAQMLYNYCATMVRSSGDASHPLLFLSISGAVNVLLNVFFVALCGMGVDGVALATILSQYLSVAMILVFMYRSNGDIRFSFKELRIDPSLVKSILKIGIPSGIQSVLFSLSHAVVQSSINSLGDTAVAGITAAANIDNWVCVACNSGYHASVAFVGQNMGAKRYDNVKKVILYCVICAVAVGLIFGGVILATPKTFLRIFTSNDSAVIAAGLSRLYTTVPLFFIYGIMDVLSGALRGMGKSTLTMAISLVTVCAFHIVWINTAFVLSPTLTTIFVVGPITWILTSSIYAFLIVKYFNRLTSPTSSIA